MGPAATTPPFTAVNYGWKCREGLVCSSTAPSSCNVSSCGANCTVTVGTAQDPIYAYIQASTSNCSITGGYVYRGTKFPEHVGAYVDAVAAPGARRMNRFDSTLSATLACN